MSAKKTYIKTNSESTIKDVAVGYFKIEGSLSSLEHVTAYIKTDKTEIRRGRQRAVRDDIPKAFIKFELHDFTPDAKFSIPSDIASKLRLGHSYEIQCTIIEKKGNNEDA